MDDYYHLLTFEDVKDKNGKIIRDAKRDVESLLALCCMAIFMNALDKRTYMPFLQPGMTLTADELRSQKEIDLNAIPLVERRHCCYIRGLTFDLFAWFLNHYSIECEHRISDDPYLDTVVPIAAALGRDMVLYKQRATEEGKVGVCSPKAFEKQVEMSLFRFDGMEECYKGLVELEVDTEQKERYESGDLKLVFALDHWHLTKNSPVQQYNPPVNDFLADGKNRADTKYFAGIESVFPACMMQINTHISS